MGKPIKKTNFGDPLASTSTGFELSFQADLGSGTVTAWALSQTSTSEYKLTDGTDVKDCELVKTISGPGEATLTCYPHAGAAAETVDVLTQHRIRTFEGSDFSWKHPTVKDGEATLIGAVVQVEGTLEVTGTAATGGSVFVTNNNTDEVTISMNGTTGANAFIFTPTFTVGTPTSYKWVYTLRSGGTFVNEVDPAATTPTIPSVTHTQIQSELGFTWSDGDIVDVALFVNGSTVHTCIAHLVHELA